MSRTKASARGSLIDGPGWMGIALLALALLLLALPQHAAAQSEPKPAAAEVAAPADAPEAAPADEAFTNEELRKLLAPFALYPDALLAQLLPACAYPIDIVQAARWLDKNEAAVKKDDFSGADKQGWDPTVKALVRFPDVIQKLNEDLDATTDLGDAFVNQPEDVANVIQELRAEAEKGGSLKSSPQQTVTVQQQGSSSYIVIEPTDPEVIYVPTYDPATVYYDGTPGWVSGAIGFGVGVAVGVAIDNAWDWGRGWVYPPRWPGYPGYRPGYPGYRPPGNVNIGNDITIGGGDRVNIGNGNIGNGNTRPWRPDNDRYRPGQGSKPGLADKVERKRPGGEGVKRPAGAPGKGPNLGGQNIGQNAGQRGDLKGPAGIDRGNAIDRGAAGAKRPEAGKRPEVAKRPEAGKRPTPQAKNPVAKRPAEARPAPKVKQPAARPQVKKAPNPTAFSDVRRGGGSPAYANRGAASRQSVNRAPRGGGGGGMNRGGGGGGRRR